MARHTKTLTRSFAGGEMSPEMFSRADDVMFQAGAETLQNCIPRATGAAARRPGTRLIREIRDSTNAAHLFSFVFSETQSSIIEASRATIGGLDSGYFRFHTNGGTLLYPQPERFWPALAINSTVGFSPCRTVTCTAASPMLVSLTAHGLKEGDEVRFIGSARTVPDAATAFVSYYVQLDTANTFWLSATKGGTKINVTNHKGYYPILWNWNRWALLSAALQTIMIDEHRVKNKEPVLITTWPTTLNPAVTFSQTTSTATGSSFVASQVTSGLPVGLDTVNPHQQVMFVADGTATGGTAGAILPSNIVEGRLYWTIGYDSVTGWELSETFEGAAMDVGSGGLWTAASSIRMCAMPQLEAGSLAAGAFGALTRYYAIVSANDPNSLKLEASIGAGQVTNGGFEFNPRYAGSGPFKIHHAYEEGDIASFPDSSGDLRSYYQQKNWWDPDLEADQRTITKEMHNSSDPRTPGSRTALTEGAYWRELAGRTTGDVVAMDPREYVGSGALTINTVGGISHGFETDMPVSFVAGDPPTPLSLNTVYWAIRNSASQIGLSLTKTGSAVTGPDSQEARHGSVLMEAFVAFDTTSHEVWWASHGLSNGDTVVFSGSDYGSPAMQSPLVFGTVYYVREKTTDEFRVSATAAGPLIDLTVTTAGVLVAANANSIYEVPHDYALAELPRIVTTQSGDVMTMASRDHPATELRRLSSTKWETKEPEFVADIVPPGEIYAVSTVLGEGTRITEMNTDNGNSYFITGTEAAGDTEHTFTPGTPVYVDGFLATSGPGSFTPGYYITGHPLAGGSQEKHIWLNSVESNEAVTHGGDAGPGLNGRIRYGTSGEDRAQKYVATAINKNNEESAAGKSSEVSNNLFVSGASNTIGWGASPGAVRYRVYKELSGLYGLIGETDELTFKDDNIGPDLAVSPPLVDSSLRQEARVTFNAVADTVGWVAHGLSARMPVVFKTSDQLPGPTEGATYFVLNPGTDEFQIATDPDDSSTVVSITGTDTGNHSAITGNFPSTTTYFEGRRVFGGSRALPQDIWMSASGTEGDMSYSIPTVDSDRIYFRVSSREISAIRHMIPLSQLVLLSESTEYRLTPANDDILTPTSIKVRPQSYVGAGYPHPSLVNNTVVFAAARGGHMRELGYNRDEGGYLTGDLSIRASHLFDGLTIADQAYAKAPLPVVWCVSSSGKLLGITYIPEENVGAWHQHTTPGEDSSSVLQSDSGVFESVAVVPEGDEDAVYVVVKRKIAGVDYRFVERFADDYRGETADLPDAFFVDCGLTYSGTSTTSIAGLDHLEGMLVSYLADGVAGTATVASGAITVAASTKVHVGLGFTTTIKTLPLSMMRVDAFGTGRKKNVNNMWVRVFQSGAFSVGVEDDDLRPSLDPASGALLSGLVEVMPPAGWDDDGNVFIVQSTPLPLTVSGITIEVASGG